MGKTKEIPNLLMTIEEASLAVSISTKTLRKFIRSGCLRAINLGIRMTRIHQEDLIELTEKLRDGENIPNLASPLPFYNKDKKEESVTPPKPNHETGSVNKTAKCRKTPRAGEKAPDGVTHDTHYTMQEVLNKFNVKYGRFYEIRNRYSLQSIHAWGTTCFNKDDVEQAITQYNAEQGKDLGKDWYSCFDIMKLFGLGKTQVRRFAETHGVRIKHVKGGRANYYLKSDWDAARRKAARKSAAVKAMRIIDN